MAYIKPDGSVLTVRNRGALAIAYGLLSHQKVEELSKDKDGRTLLIRATNDLVYALWGKGELRIDTSRPFVPGPIPRPDPAIIDWLRSRKAEP